MAAGRNRVVAPTLPGHRVPTWTRAKREPAPAPTRAAGWRPREAPTLRRALLNRLRLRLAFGYALPARCRPAFGAPWPIWASAPPGLDLAGQPSQPG